jgi:hypothetical protein
MERAPFKYCNNQSRVWGRGSLLKGGFFVGRWKSFVVLGVSIEVSVCTLYIRLFWLMKILTISIIIEAYCKNDEIEVFEHSSSPSQRPDMRAGSRWFSIPCPNARDPVSAEGNNPRVV